MPVILSLVAASTVVLDPVIENLHDPMELAPAPDGSLYIIEREGRVLRANPATGGLFEIGRIEVSALRDSDPRSPRAREDGLLGIALDPGFTGNHRLYLYYSHPEKLLNRLSRFTLSDGRLDPASEKVLLEIPTERDERVSHPGGSIEFGPDGLLHLSTGDNTSPFESRSKAPLDDREGKQHGDAMRSAGNTNDLRGKILRIRLTEQGYEIPQGNLFPPGTPDTRPEIYVMGCRNPFRISIDPRSGFLYWGEVGPDARDADELGPMGYDELNQAREAGNFGWPFVIADNRPYPIVDFATARPVAATDPAAPRNPGRRNTGLKILPPARPAMIAYTYGDSEEFPELGSGGRNAMAGPVFYYDSSNRWNVLPEAGDHSLLFYDWVRGRLWKTRLDANERPTTVETIAGGLRHPMDLEFGPDGSLWLLEYGTNWYFNRDGRIRRILPAGTPPLPAPGIVADGNGFKAVGLDRPAEWWITLGNGETRIGTGPSVGNVPAGATEIRAVFDSGDGRPVIARHLLQSDDERPTLDLELDDPPDALGFGESVSYRLLNNVSDPIVRIRYVPTAGHDTGGPQVAEDIAAILRERLCIACHQIDSQSVGPRYTDVALRYRNQADARDKLLAKLRSGGQGNWGPVAMPPQITITDPEAERVVAAILRLADGMTERRGERRGRLETPAGAGNALPGGHWELTAEAAGYLPARIRIPAK